MLARGVCLRFRGNPEHVRRLPHGEGGRFAVADDGDFAFAGVAAVVFLDAVGDALAALAAGLGQLDPGHVGLGGPFGGGETLDLEELAGLGRPGELPPDARQLHQRLQIAPRRRADHDQRPCRQRFQCLHALDSFPVIPSIMPSPPRGGKRKVPPLPIPGGTGAPIPLGERAARPFCPNHNPPYSPPPLAPLFHHRHGRAARAPGRLALPSFQPQSPPRAPPTAPSRSPAPREHPLRRGGGARGS